MWAVEPIVVMPWAGSIERLSPSIATENIGIMAQTAKKAAYCSSHEVNGIFHHESPKAVYFYLWPVPWTLGIADNFSGTWVSYAAFAIAAVQVAATLATAWAAFWRSRRH